MRVDQVCVGVGDRVGPQVVLLDARQSSVRECWDLWPYQWLEADVACLGKQRGAYADRQIVGACAVLVDVGEVRGKAGPGLDLQQQFGQLVPRQPLSDQRFQRQGDEFQLLTSGQVAASVERHLNAPRPVSLSSAALQVLTIVAYRQPVSQAGIEGVCGTSSDSAIGTLL
jgi:hypothetical protein